MNCETFNAYSPKELEYQIQEFKDKFGKVGFAFYFAPDRLPHQNFLDVFAKDKINVLGATTDNQIEGPKHNDIGIITMLMDLDISCYKMFKFESNEMNAEQLGSKIYATVENVFSEQSVLLFTAGDHISGDCLVRGLKSAGKDSDDYFGGLAVRVIIGSQMDNNPFTDMLNNGVVAVVFDGSKIQVKGVAIGGWKGIGTRKIVTRAEKNIIYEIDNTPVLEFFKRYFMVEGEEMGEDNMISEYPLQIYREDGTYVSRVLKSIDKEKGSATFFGEIPQGACLNFAFPVISDVILNTIQELKKFKENRNIQFVDATLIFSCCIRFRALQHLVNKEIELIQQTLGAPQAGIFTWGEIGALDQGLCDFHNTTITLVMFTEINPKESRKEYIPPQYNFEDIALTADALSFVSSNPQEQLDAVTSRYQVLKREKHMLQNFLSQTSIDLEKAKTEIEQQRDEITEQKQIIEAKNKNITDSITYALNIQRTILPSRELINKLIPDSFVIYRPRDIVSGDFYWLIEKDQKIILAAVDCTGHGVPGGFVSMLGSNLLRQTVNEKLVTASNEILNSLSEGVNVALRQGNEDFIVKDGMDIAICVIDYQSMIIQFSGVHNPMYHVHDGELTEYKSDHHPIGEPLSERFKGYEKTDVPFKKGDMIYIFTDGYADQSGGPEKQRFKSKYLREKILTLHSMSMQEQKIILENNFDDWKGNIPQVDDVLLMGVKL